VNERSAEHTGDVEMVKQACCLHHSAGRCQPEDRARATLPPKSERPDANGAWTVLRARRSPHRGSPVHTAPGCLGNDRPRRSDCLPGPQREIDDVITENQRRIGHDAIEQRLIAAGKIRLRIGPGLRARPSVPPRRSSPFPSLIQKRLLALLACNSGGGSPVRTPSTHKKAPLAVRGA